METVKWGEMNVGQGVPLVEAGFYLVKVGEIEKTVAKTGTEQMLVHGVVAEGELEGSPVQTFLALTTAALWRVGAFVQAAGHDLKSLPNMVLCSEEFFRVLNSCKGRLMTWDITQEVNPKSGKIQNKVNSFIQYDSDDQEPLIYSDNVPSFIKNKTAAKKAGLL